MKKLEIKSYPCLVSCNAPFTRVASVSVNFFCFCDIGFPFASCFPSISLTCSNARSFSGFCIARTNSIGTSSAIAAIAGFDYAVIIRRSYVLRRDMGAGERAERAGRREPTKNFAGKIFAPARCGEKCKKILENRRNHLR